MILESSLRLRLRKNDLHGIIFVRTILFQYYYKFSPQGVYDRAYPLFEWFFLEVLKKINFFSTDINLLSPVCLPIVPINQAVAAMLTERLL